MPFPSAVEAYEAQRLAVAQRDGFALFAVAGTDVAPAFVYTVGLCQHGLPELLCFSTPEMQDGTQVMMRQLASHMILGCKRFAPASLVAALVKNGLTVRDPEVHYSPEFLTGDDFLYALKGYVTRATRFRHDLGMPRGVLVMNHDGVPTLQQLRAEMMLASV